MIEDRKQVRRKAAEERQAKCNALTPEQRLAALDKTFGAGLGAKKERARLQKMLTDAKTPAPKAELTVQDSTQSIEESPKKTSKKKKSE